jgi:hypothetical protein
MSCVALLILDLEETMSTTTRGDKGSSCMCPLLGATGVAANARQLQSGLGLFYELRPLHPVCLNLSVDCGVYNNNLTCRGEPGKLAL